MKGHFWKLGEASQNSRRVAAQFFFFLSGVSAVLLFAGVETWARGVIAFFLGLACFLEASVVEELPGKISKSVLFLLGGFFLLMVYFQLPIPDFLAGHLVPGQVKLSAELKGFRPTLYHGSMSPLDSREQILSWLCGLGVIGLAWYWACESFFRRTLIFFIVILGGVVACLGLYDRLDGSPLMYGFRRTVFIDHWGPFVNRNHFANFMNLAALMGLGIFFRYMFPLSHQRRSVTRALTGLFLGSSCALLSLVSASRGGVVSLLGGVLCLMGLLVFKRRLKGQVVGILLMVCLGMGFMHYYGQPVLERFSRSFKSEAGLGQDGRVLIWKDVWSMVLQHEGRGIGPGAFEKIFPAYQKHFGHRTVAHAENEYLEFLSEWGIPGLLLVIGLLGLVLARAFSILRHHPREWELAGWSAIFMISIHMGVDFPLHISANSWVVLALLGLLLRGHHSQKESEDSLEWSNVTYRRWLLIALSLVLFLSVHQAFLGSPTTMRRLEDQLALKDFSGVQRLSQEVLIEFPFYWRAHELVGIAAWGSSSGGRESLRCFERAQRLSMANPHISLRAGLLFVDHEPAVGRDFFERALGISSEPLILFHEIIGNIRHLPQAGAVLIPLGMSDSDRWLSLRGILNDHELLETSQQAADLWLEDPRQREKILPALISGRQVGRVLKALEDQPPRNLVEKFWQARAWEMVGEHETAVNLYAAIWSEQKVSIPSYEQVQITPSILQDAIQAPTDPRLPGRIGETFMGDGKYGEALAYWSKALSLDPQDERARLGLAQCHQMIGQWQEAAECWRNLLVKHFSLY